MRGSKVYWQCEYSHTGTVPSRPPNSDNPLGEWMVGIEQLHAREHGNCPSTALRIAPTVELLDNDDISITWKIDKPRINQSFAERSTSLIYTN